MAKKSFEDGLSESDKILLQRGPMRLHPWDWNDPLMVKRYFLSKKDYDSLVDASEDFYENQKIQEKNEEIQEEIQSRSDFEDCLRAEKQEESNEHINYFKQPSYIPPLNSKDDFDDDYDDKYNSKPRITYPKFINPKDDFDDD
jgi:hypothetical protein